MMTALDDLRRLKRRATTIYKTLGKIRRSAHLLNRSLNRQSEQISTEGKKLAWITERLETRKLVLSLVETKTEEINTEMNAARRELNALVKELKELEESQAELRERRKTGGL